MALNKYATIRYRVIDRCLRSKSHPWPSKEKLRQACEEELYGSSNGEHISLSTIDKDLWALKNESSLGYAPIAYSKSKNGYYYKDDQFSLDLPLNEEDIELIRIATSTLKQFQNSRIFQDLEVAVNKIEGRLNVINHMDRNDNREVIRFETAPAFAGSELLPQLLESIRAQKVLTINYEPFLDQKMRLYEVQPYFLQEHKNRWYLICYETAGETFRTLGLDRIVSLAETGKHFTLREDFNPEEYYHYSFGIGIYNGKPEEVILSFNPIQGKYIQSQPIHQTQEVIEQNEQELRIRLKVIISPEFIMHLLSYGPEVKVITPQNLQQAIIKSLTAAQSQY